MDVIHNLRQRYTGAAALHRKLVFWYDADAEQVEAAREALAELGVQVLELTPNNLFATKYRLEVEDPDRPYLLYAAFKKPETLNNWLLDLLLYSEEFSTDRAALLMHELRLEQLAVREFLEQQMKFFNNTERVRRLSKLLPQSPTQEQLVLGMLAVLTGAESIQLTTIVRHVLLAGLDVAANRAYQEIKKFFSLPIFWEQVRDHFGIVIEDTDESLQTLFRTLVCHHFLMELDFEVQPPWSSRFAAYPSAMPNTCRIFIEDWQRAPAEEREVLERMLAELEIEWSIRELLVQQPYELYQRCDTFRATEDLYLERLTDELEQDTASSERWQELLAVRRTKHWYDCEPYASLYQALEAALPLAEWKYRFETVQAPQDGKAWVELYTDHLSQIDRLYRTFMTAMSASHAPERLQTLHGQIENWYAQHYLIAVGRWTDRLLDETLLQEWPIYGVAQQNDFYQDHIWPLVQATTERVFVIISDAFRYEVGTELAERLQLRLNAKVTLTPLQATVPSYTQLGMASLLPGRHLSLQGREVLVNGMGTQSLPKREAVLQAKEPRSRAMWLKDFIAKKAEEGMNEIRSQRVVYLYHDVIDSTGDKQRSETYTFRAVAETLREVEGAVDKLVRTYSAVRIFVTGDHGFLFQTGDVAAPDKTAAVSGDVIERNRRFAIGRDLTVPEGARKISLAYLGLDAEAVIALGVNRFQSSGGARYVHGGAMPQEAILPLIEYREIRGQAKRSEQPFVDVRLTNRERVITSYRYPATFFQEQKAEEKRLPRHLRMALYREGERISNEVTLVFDSQEEPDRRCQDVIFSLQEQAYASGETCVLRMEEVSTAQTTLYREERLELRLYEMFR